MWGQAKECSAFKEHEMSSIAEAQGEGATGQPQGSCRTWGLILPGAGEAMQGLSAGNFTIRQRVGSEQD